jgi:hypothetical protein
LAVKVEESSKPPQKIFGRMGPVTKGEKEFVAQFVQDMPGPISERQLGALSKTMRRSKEVLRQMIEEAAEQFQENARFYIDTHRQATQDALKSDTMAGKDIAIKASQWAIENLSGGGARIVEKAASGAPTGTKITVGVKIGGLNEPIAVGVQSE